MRRGRGERERQRGSARRVGESRREKRIKIRKNEKKGVSIFEYFFLIVQCKEVF